MKITFLGAANEVTGSCTLIEAGGKNIFIDYGMEQGRDMFERQEPPMGPANIDCVLLTHAHIDHSGNLPLLYKNGFRGTVYATEPTVSLCEIMLMDSAYIQMSAVERKNRKARRSGGDLFAPLYDIGDVAGVLSNFCPCRYNEMIQVFDNVQIRFADAGHLLGASSIELWVSEGGETKKLVFSGDLGNTDRPMLNSPQAIEEADYVVVESTYGNREHKTEQNNYLPELAEHIQKTLCRGGNVVIPSFAVGRTQELLYFIGQIKDEGMVKGCGDFKVYLDSPLAREATEIFLRCGVNNFDAETEALICGGVNPLYFEGLTVSVTPEDSTAINTDPEPKVIISASGMCEAGRIRHHLKHNLWREESLVLFAGYQTEGTLGRTLLDKAKPAVKIFEEEIAVKAEIAKLGNTSGHADRRGITNWLAAFRKKPRRIFVNHGTEESCGAFTEYLKSEHGYDAAAPYSGTSYDLSTGEVVVQTAGIKSKKTQKAKDPRQAEAFLRLMGAIGRLSDIAKGSEGMPQKELAKFAEEINRLSDAYQK